ncbi:MAG: Holliday junction branch migration protein RuvA [Candidatus Komeilibacteria bacterium]
MISFIKGNIIIRQERYLVIDIGSLGYQVYCTSQTLEKLRDQNEVSLFTHTHVREDAMELYGFITWEEMEFFEKLIEISGVGPKSALAVMSVAPLEDIKKAVVHGDPAILQRVTGIGKKTAERIIVELKEKIKFSSPLDSNAIASLGDSQLFEGLQSLGYKEREIRQILPQIPIDVTDLGERIKEALKLLSNQK